jgi:hypothetical protein
VVVLRRRDDRHAARLRGVRAKGLGSGEERTLLCCPSPDPSPGGGGGGCYPAFLFTFGRSARMAMLKPMA